MHTRVHALLDFIVHLQQNSNGNLLYIGFTVQCCEKQCIVGVSTGLCQAFVSGDPHLYG